jgi:membrane protease YdiL (CAAX protease family)
VSAATTDALVAGSTASRLTGPSSPIARPERRGRAALPAALALGTVMFLLSRSALAGLGTGAMALGYAAMTAGSAALAGPRPRAAPAGRWTPLAVGIGAVVLARALSGASPPLPLTATVMTLNLAAAVAEEAFFRGFLFARLEAWGTAVAIVVTALAFALIHLPLYGVAAFPVDLGAGLLLSWQRAASGTWAVPAATHALANVLAVLR